MKWTVKFSRYATKQTQKINKRLLRVFQLLIEDLISDGPMLSNKWSNFGKLKGVGDRELWHSHLIKGKPTYVCCWEVIDKLNRVIEVYYVGSHEKAPS